MPVTEEPGQFRSCIDVDLEDVVAPRMSAGAGRLKIVYLVLCGSRGKCSVWQREEIEGSCPESVKEVKGLRTQRVGGCGVGMKPRYV